jgi:UDP-glucose 4-epimerase
VKILVTGGAGYIGGTVAGKLVQSGHEPVLFDNFSHSRCELAPKGIEWVTGDVCDGATLRRTFAAAESEGKPFAAVMHFAALIEAGESMACPEKYFRNNTVGTLTLAESMVASGVKRLVFSSTAAVYGAPRHVPIQEDALIEPVNPYGESKALSERILEWFHRVHGLRYAALRYFNVAGAAADALGGEAHEPETHLIPRVLDVALGRQSAMKIYGDDYPTPDGTCVRDYIHVSDLAEAHLLALSALEDIERLIINLGNGQGFSVCEVLESARRVTGHPIPAEVHPRRSGDPPVLVASAEKAGRVLGWKPKIPELDAIVASAWKWHRKRYGD